MKSPPFNIRKGPVKGPNCLPYVLAVLCPAFANAQFVVEDDEANRQEVIELSPFEVRATEGTGYRITDSNTATRVSLDLREIPFNISVLGREFLDNIGARESLDVFAAEASTSVPTPFITVQNTRPFIRGTSSSRFYVDGIFFNSLISPDAATDRIEILKGPSGMLFGQAEPGGTLNYVLKQARARPVTKLDFHFGSYQEYGFGVDLGGPLDKEKKLLHRFAMDYKRMDDNWIDYFKFENLDLYQRFRYNYASGSYLQGTAYYGKRYMEGTARPSPNYPGYGNINPFEAEVMRTRYTTQGMPTPIEAGLITRSTNLHNPEAFGDVYTISYWGEWTHHLGNLGTLKLVVNDNHMRRDGWRPGTGFTVVAYGPTNTRQEVFDAYNEGKRFTVARGDILYVQSEDLRYSNTYGRSATANWLLERIYGRFRFKTVLGVDWTFEQFTDRRFRSEWHYEVNPANGLSRLKPQIWSFRPVIANIFRPEEGVRRITPPFETYNVPDGKFDNVVRGPGYYTFNFLDFHEGRFLVTFAGRYDQYDMRNITMRMDRDPGDPDYRFSQENSGDVTTWSAGAIYNFNAYLGVYSNWATSFRPLVSVLRDRDGNQFQPYPTTGKGGDLGVRLNLLKDRLSINSSVFTVRRENLPQMVSEINEQGFVVNYDVQSGVERTRGFEVEAIGEVTKNLELRFGWTHLDSEVLRNEGNPNLVGQRGAQTPKNKIAFTPRYTFREGRFNGLTLGSQMTFVIDDAIYPSAPRDPLSSRPYHEGYKVYNVFAHYNFRLSPKVGARIQLNVMNVTSTKYTEGRPMGPIRFRLTTVLFW